MNMAALVVAQIALSGVSQFDVPVEGKCSWFVAGRKAAINSKAGPYYCAMRWDYDALAEELGVDRSEVKAELAKCTVLVYSRETGKSVVCKVADWGPHKKTGRTIDLSQKAISVLESETDDVLVATLRRAE